MVYYWYVYIPQCGYMENGSKDMKCYVQKHIEHWGICCNPALVNDKLSEALAYCETRILDNYRFKRWYVISMGLCKTLVLYLCICNGEWKRTNDTKVIHAWCVNSQHQTITWYLKWCVIYIFIYHQWDLPLQRNLLLNVKFSFTENGLWNCDP